MTWDSYIDNLLGHGQGHTDKVAIIGLNGAKWTTDAHPASLKISLAEARVIGKAVNDDDEDTFQTKGVLVEGLKYQFLRRDENVYHAKLKDHGCISMQKTKTAVVIAHTKEGGSLGNTSKAVNAIAEYLEGLLL